jgi:hypothetical protein
MHDDPLSDDIRRAFGRGYRPPDNRFADRVLVSVFERSGPDGLRRGPGEHWLAAVAAVALAAVVVTVLVTLSMANRSHSTPGSAPHVSSPPSSPVPQSPSAGPQTVVIRDNLGEPLQSVDWTGKPVGAFVDLSPGAGGLTMAPDGSRAALVAPSGPVQIIDSQGRVLVTMDSTLWSGDAREVRWADDSRHWCALNGGALLYSEIQSGKVQTRRFALSGPGLPSDAVVLVACSATTGRAVIVVQTSVCVSKGCAGHVDVVDLRTGTVTGALTEPAGATFGDPVASADGHFFAESDRVNDRSLVWDLTTGAIVDQPSGIVQALSGDGRMMATVTAIMGPLSALRGHLIDRTTGRDVWSAPGESMQDLLFRPGGEECMLASNQDVLLIRPDGSVTVVVHDPSPTSYPQVYGT